ncbi:hypothetical protein EDD18DRAFT_1113134 [Armillaria luteobubalina]|uniref:Uncharacterized protein n=1 Tax=Armillaria luteobubalina TaxID=153913 RepID=A0AA39UG75_9AGAR|nr:hypothetical protein EDD18DRAFT_1113134 [Armillaria luteobubalina]
MAASGLLICNFDGDKVTNTHLPPSNINSHCKMEDWELPVSEIRSWIYSLIEYWGFDTVVAFRNRVMEEPSDEGGGQLLACEREVLENHAAVSDHIRSWRNDVSVVPGHSPPIHPFDAHRRVFAFFDNKSYTPSEAPNEAPPLRALIHEYDRWFLLTLLRKFRYDDAKASERRNILWRLVHHDPYTEPYDSEDFMRGRRDHETRNYRASRDEPTKAIYNNTTSVGPSGLTSTMPGQSYPQPQPRQQLQAYTPAPPTSQLPTLGLPAGYPRSFDGPALIAFYEQESRTRASDVKQ